VAWLASGGSSHRGASPDYALGLAREGLAKPDGACEVHRGILARMACRQVALGDRRQGESARRRSRAPGDTAIALALLSRQGRRGRWAYPVPPSRLT
jgi:hypothetical protein